MSTLETIDTQETPAEVLERVRTEASERCHSACTKAKEMVVRNPVPTIFGALVFGAAVGYLVYSRRQPLSLSDKIVRDAHGLRKTLSDGSHHLSSLFHDGLDVASKHAKKANDRFHDIPVDDVLHSVADSLGRVRNRLKFW